jgi:hypothetical protein
LQEKLVEKLPVPVQKYFQQVILKFRFFKDIVLWFTPAPSVDKASAELALFCRRNVIIENIYNRYK